MCLIPATKFHSFLACYRTYRLGKAYPSRPGFIGIFGITVLQDLHWIDIWVAFALIPLAATTIPGILTKRDTRSDPSPRTDIGSASDWRMTWMASSSSSPNGLGEVISSAT